MRILDVPPDGGGDDCLMLVLVQPGSPPGERGIGNDLVAAQRHEVYVLIAFRARVPVHIDRLRLSDEG